MPRPRKPGAPEPKRRSRLGCHNCKKRKIKCGEEKPACENCVKQRETCDYSLILNWEGRSRKKADEQDGFQESLGALSSPSATSTTLDALPQRPRSGASSATFSSPPIAFSSINSRPSSRAAATSQQSNKGPQWGSFGLFHAQNDPADGRRKRRRLDASSSTGTGPMPLTPGLSATAPSPPFSGESKGFASEHEETSMLTPETPGYSGCPASAPMSPTHASSSFDIKPTSATPKDTPTIPRNYGYDQGRPDLDIPRNDDANALKISGSSGKFKKLKRDIFQEESDDSDHSFGFGVRPRGAHLERSSYYSSPLPVTIPVALEPLPARLTANPMNLLYFHHFLNHTARILVPHDCPENAFRNILPQMALQNEHLLNLLLAYSAHHRSRLLKHPEPKTRIALWVRDVFPSLRIALNDTRNPISDASLGAAIMLSSLEIVSPNAFELPNISWQNHLGFAREMIVARGGYHALRHGDKVSYFLSRWFAYLDILGSLSGSNYERPLTDNRRSCDREEDFDNEDEIDCFLGFTGRCIAVLAEVANLAKDCENKRRYIEATTGQHWIPSEDMKARARPLEAYLKDIKPTTYRGCSHRQVKSDTADAAVNEAFHHAGLIHLYRRVLNYETSSNPVQDAVRAVQRALDQVEDRSIACMIFPVFSAGCEAQTSDSRKVFLACLKTVEHMGMAAAKRARTVMEKVWETGRSWQELVAGEFVG